MRKSPVDAPVAYGPGAACLSLLLGLGLQTVPAAAASSTCQPAPDPVISLSYGSRYTDDDKSRSTLDAESNAEVNKALRPVDDFIRDLVNASNKVLKERDQHKAAAQADCVLSQIATWAHADALSKLDSYAARLSSGARISGIAEAYRQIRPFISDMDQAVLIEDWLTTRANEQIDFWEKDATTGARTGNLRAWSALAVLNIGEVTQNDGFIWWSAASAMRILCTARKDGSLPQETKRGSYGLHYQFHALAPLVTIAARLDDRGAPILKSCDGALERVVTYAFDDYAQKGALTEGYSGKQQSYFDGTEDLEDHELAFMAAYLRLVPNSPLGKWVLDTTKLSNSKLGGDQRLLWQIDA